MGCNFYFLDKIAVGDNGDDEDYRGHIGKRSAAGAYCWDCGQTLCVGGEDEIHSSKSDWHEECPNCELTTKDSAKETMETSAAGRELGFNKSNPKSKTGIASCSSFTWAISLRAFLGVVTKYHRRKIVRDEYGSKYTLAEFLDVLQEAPVQYFDSIETDFS